MAHGNRAAVAAALGKGVLVASLITLAGMLLLAALVMLLPMSDGVLIAANQALKLISIALGARVGVRALGRRGFAVGACVGLIYMATGYALYCLLDGAIANALVMTGEFALGALAGALCGALTVNLGSFGRRKRIKRA